MAAEAVSLSYKFQGTVQQTLDTDNTPGAPAPVITHTDYNTNGTLNASSSSPATKMVAFAPTLVAAALTIDLTSLTGTNGASVTFSGLKLQYILFNNGVTTSGAVAAGGNSAVTIGFGAANPYPLFGASKEIIVLPGDSFCMRFSDTLADVSGSAKDIDLAGTGTDAFECVLVAG